MRALGMRERMLESLPDEGAVLEELVLPELEEADLLAFCLRGGCLPRRLDPKSCT